MIGRHVHSLTQCTIINTLLILLLYISSQYLVGVVEGVRWSFTTATTNDDDDLVTVRSPIQLHYVGEDDISNVATFIQWSTSDSTCTIARASTLVANMTCTTAGVKQVQLLRTVTNTNTTTTVNITVSSSTACYSWRTVFVHSSTYAPITLLPPFDSSSTIALRIWIDQLSAAAAAAITTTTATPSALAAQTTRQFYRLSERPQITQHNGHSVDSQLVVHPNITFNKTGGFWYTTVRTQHPGTVLARVYGVGVALLGCSVAPYTHHWSVQKYTVASFAPITSVSSVLATAGMAASHVYDACATNIRGGVVPNTSYAYLTQDNFNTIALRSVGGGAETLVDMAFTNQSVVLLSNTTLYYIPAGTTNVANALVATGTSGGGGGSLNRVRAQQACDRIRAHNDQTSSLNRYVFAWHTHNGTHVYVSRDAGATYTSLAIPSSFGGVVTRVHAVVRLINDHRIVCLVTIGGSSSSIDVVLGYDEASKQWTRGYTFTSTARLGGTALRPINMLHAPSGTDVLLLWGERVYYSLDGGLDADVMEFRRTDGHTAQTFGTGGEYVHNVVANVDGKIVVITSQARMFVGAFGLNYVTEINTRHPPSVITGGVFSVWTTYQYHVYELQARASPSPCAVKTRVPIANALLSNVAQVCRVQVQNWTQPSVEYLDLRDPPIRRLVDVVVPQSTGEMPVYSVAGSEGDGELLSVSAEQTRELSAVVGFERVTLKLSVAVDNSIRWTATDVSNPVTVLTALQPSPLRCTLNTLSSSSTSWSSFTPVQHVSRVNVGCPPGRHIRVRFTRDCAEHTSFPYGCPIRLFHQRTDGWLPRVDLYDDDVFVREVTGNYVLRELNHRADYYLTASAADVGCKRTPTTWKDRVTAFYTKHNRWPVTLDDYDQAWLPTDTVDCFSGSGVVLDSEYELMNSSGMNVLMFKPTGNDGMFVFRVRVVDPRYSFCNLTTTFELDVFGAPLSLSITLAVVSTVTVCILIALGVTYVHYSRHIVATKKQQ